MAGISRVKRFHSACTRPALLSVRSATSIGTSRPFCTEVFTDTTAHTVDNVTGAISEALPKSLIAGLAAGGDLTSGGRAAMLATGASVVEILDQIAAATLPQSTEIIQRVYQQPVREDLVARARSAAAREELERPSTPDLDDVVARARAAAAVELERRAADLGVEPPSPFAAVQDAMDEATPVPAVALTRAEMIARAKAIAASRN